MITYLRAVVIGLNALSGNSAATLEIGNLTAAQAAAHEVIVAAALAFAERLDHAEYERGDDGWNHFEQGADAPRLELIAAAVAVPDCAATCDPVELVRPDLGRRIASVDEIFPNPPAGLNTFSGFHGGQRREYVALTARQLRAGLLRLHSSCRGGASVFPVGKAEGKQRVVWNGTRVSNAAVRPPPPLDLADPAAFGLLDLAAGAKLRVTKRDCRTWFDQLAVSPAIGAFFGQPSVTRTELIGAGLSEGDLARMGAVEGCATLVPCSCVWQMGFSWSSCVAQGTLMAVCAEAGLADSCVLACDAPLPDSMNIAFAVATDDLMVFSDSGPGRTLKAATAVEEVMLKRGILKNPDKDVDDVFDATCIGIDLVDGSAWCPPPARMWKLLDAVVDLATARRCSPGGVAAYLGTTQWFDLLRRLQLCVFSEVYSFSSGAKAKDWAVVDAPNLVISELLLDMVLYLFGKVDMHLPFLPVIAATDASTEFGHGGAVADATVSEVRAIARMACKSGGHVR